MSVTMFHTHRRQRTELYFYISWFFNFWTATWMTEDSAPNDSKHSLTVSLVTATKVSAVFFTVSTLPPNIYIYIYTVRKYRNSSSWPTLMQCYTFCGSQERPFFRFGRVQLKCDGTRWRTGGELKGKLANGVGSQYPSHCLRTCCIQHYYSWCANLGCQQSTELTPTGRSNWILPFRWKTKSGFCGCAITFQTQPTSAPTSITIHRVKPWVLPVYCLFLACYCLVTARLLPVYFPVTSWFLPG